MKLAEKEVKEEVVEKTVKEEVLEKTVIINQDEKKHKDKFKNKLKDFNRRDLTEKLKNFFKKLPTRLINTKLFVVIIAILIILKTLLIYKTVLFPNDPLEIKNIYTTVAFSFIILSIPMLLKNKSRFICAMLINLFISILLCINEIYYSYSTNLVSISQISNLQYGKEISAALPNLVNIKQIVYFIDIIIILILCMFKKIKLQKEAKYNKIVSIVYIAIVGILIYLASIWLTEAAWHPYNKITQVKLSSIYGYHYLDLSNNLNMKKNLKYKEKQTMMNDYNLLKNTYNENYSSVYDFTDIAKDKNVIIVQLESIQNFVVNRKINGYEITPNLNKFINENIEFSNMQNQSYSSTADSEYSVMNSIYPLENGRSFAQYATNDYSDIYKMFKKEGYTTTYIHGNDGAFWNRYSVYSRLQIDNLIFDDVFDENTERINDYVSDEEVYRKIVDEMNNYEGKFLVNIVASSSHIAFDLPGIENKEEKVTIDVGQDYKGDFFGNYLEAVNYADYAFGVLIEELKNAGLYDDTVILVYGDHAGLQMYNFEMMDFIKEVEPLNDIKTQINYSNVLCGLKIPGVDAMKIDKPVSKLDIKPTLTEICGIEDEFSLGTSMFYNKDFVGINNERIITDKYFYNGDWYLIETGEMLDFDSLSDEIKEKLNYYKECLRKELDISLAINILNLLK